jgi:TP901 family phage tail tape measure protein
MSRLTSELVARLVDQVSGPARGIAGTLGRLKALGATAGGGLAASGDRAASSIGSLHVRLLAAGAAAYGLQRALAGTIAPAAKFETKLLDIAQKANLSDSGMEVLGRQIRGLAKDLGTAPNEFAKGVDVLLGMGMEKDSALGIMPAIVKGATAYTASIDDLAKAGMASMTSLGIKVADFSTALDALAFSGNAGAFELKEMARYLPSLMALGGSMKMSGLYGVSELGAALQVVRKNAGTSEEAATRLGDVLGKMTSDETQKKFKKLGIKDIAGDLRKAQAAAAKAGKPFSAIDFIVANLNKALKGDIGRIGEIFSDKEAKAAAIALMQHYEEFKQIRQGALGAGGLVDKDYARRLKTYEAQVNRLSGAFENLRIVAAGRFLSPLTSFVQSLGDTLGSLDGRVTVLDRLSAAMKGLASGLFGTGNDGLATGFAKLGDLILGKASSFEGDVERMGQSFEQFRRMGAALREWAEAIGSAVAAFERFSGLDFGAIASWGVTLGAAAIGVTLFAKAVRGLAAALAILTGLRALGALWRGVSSLASGAKAVPPQPPRVAPAKPQAGAAPAAAPSASPSLAGRLSGVARNGLIGGLFATGGEMLIEKLFDSIDKRFGIDGSDRPEPGILAALRRLMGPGQGVNVDQGVYERSRRVDADFRRDPEAARGRAFSGIGSGEGGEQSVRISTSDIQALIQPSGTQDVRVTNPPPAPNVSVSVTVNATTGASAAEIGSQVGAQVGAAAKRAIQSSYGGGGD